MPKHKPHEFLISYPSTASSNAKIWRFAAESGVAVDEHLPPQAVDMIKCAYFLSLDSPEFTKAELAWFIEQACEYSGTTFTRSKHGVSKIIDYYWGLLVRLELVKEVTGDDDSSVTEEVA